MSSGRTGAVVAIEPYTRLITVMTRMAAMTMLLMLPSAILVAETEVRFVQQLSAQEIVLMPSGRLLARQRVELHLPDGESELALQIADGEAPDSAVQLQVVSPVSGVDVSEIYRRPEMPDRVFWTLRSEGKQTATARLRYKPATLSVAISYQAHLRIAEGLMDLQARLTTKSDGVPASAVASVLLPTGDRVETRLEAGAAISEELFALRGIACDFRHVYDENAYGKQVMLLANFAAPDRGRALPEGPVAVVATRDGALRTMGSAAIPYSVAGSPIELVVRPVSEILVTGGLETSSQESVKQDVYRKLALYDLREEYEYCFLNRTNRALDLTFRTDHDGDWQVVDSILPHTRVDAATAKWKLALPAGAEIRLTFTILKRHLTP